jgi:hypothetical protein
LMTPRSLIDSLARRTRRAPWCAPWFPTGAQREH